MPAHDNVHASAAGTWTLGDLTVNRIGLGTKRLTAGRATALLRRALELGVDHIDTASFYPTSAAPESAAGHVASLGWANAVLRQALAPYPDHVVIATKVGPTEAGMARPEQLRGLVEENLRVLGRGHLDLVYLRQHRLESVAEHIGVLAALREEGLIRHLGLSNARVEHLDQARSVAPVVAVSNRYGIGFGRVNDEMLRRCGDLGVAFVPFFALAAERREAGGIAQHDEVAAIARRHGLTPAQVRIAWTLGQGEHVLAIPGTSDPDHLVENIAAGAVRLSDDELASLGRVEDADGPHPGG